MIEVIISAAAIVVTVATAGFGVAKAYGSNVEALTNLKDHVKEMRATQANTLARIGRLEAFAEIVPELSGRVRGNIE